MLASQILNLQPGPTPPTPPAPVAQPSGGGGPWDDRVVDATDFLADVARLAGEAVDAPAPDEAYDDALVAVEATSLSVEVRATILDVQVVERGNLISLIARFAGDPDEVHLAYLPPGSARPVVDDGFGQPSSKIRRIDEGVYVFQIDTTGFAGGDLRWHFWSVGEHQASDFGHITIPERAEQLL